MIRPRSAPDVPSPARTSKPDRRSPTRSRGAARSILFRSACIVAHGSLRGLRLRL